MSWFGRPIQLTMGYAKKRHVTRFLTNLGSNKGWKNSRVSMWLRNVH
jgi:hypothetical protein